MKAAARATGRCELCGRLVPPELLTLHHLRPREEGGGPDSRVPLCKPCHKQVHAVFSNAELARGLMTIEALRGSERLGPYLAWIRRQKPGRNFRTCLANDHPRARRRRR